MLGFHLTHYFHCLFKKHFKQKCTWAHNSGYNFTDTCVIFSTDISIAVIDLLQEMTDVDTLNESEEGATALIDALVSFFFHLFSGKQGPYSFGTFLLAWSI